MSYQTLELSRPFSGVLCVSLNRPDIRNAFNDVMIDELAKVFRQEAVDSSIRAVILRGKGDIFCAGGDLNWMKRSIELSFEDNLKDTLKLTSMFSVLNEFSKPVVGVIQGAAIGGGVGLVSICDSIS